MAEKTESLKNMGTKQLLLNYYWVKVEIKQEVKDFLEFKVNKSTTYTNLWGMMKSVIEKSP